MRIKEIKNDIQRYGELSESEKRECADIFTKYSELFNELKEKYSELFNELKEQLEPVMDLNEEIDNLQPQLKTALHDYNIRFQELMNMTLSEILTARSDPDSDIYKAFEQARKASSEPVKTTVKPVNTVGFPLDKLNNNVWYFSEKQSGAISATIDMLPNRPELKATAIYSIDFNDLEDDLIITRRLEPFDKRVYLAIASLYNAGNTVTTSTQIYKFLTGKTSRPSKRQLKNILDSVWKMINAQVIIDNKAESEALENKYPHFIYGGPLLAAEIITATINGKTTETAIHVFREPCAISFAKSRKQITTFNKSLLYSPQNKTNTTILIGDYLMLRIARTKSSGPFRVLFKTIYEHANITDKGEKRRARDKVKIELQHYKSEKVIVKFTMQKDGVTILKT